MTTTLTATYNGPALIPTEPLHLPKGTTLRLKVEVPQDLDDDTAAAINRAEEQIDCGQGLGFDRFAARLRQRISAR